MRKIKLYLCHVCHRLQFENENFLSTTVCKHLKPEYGTFDDDRGIPWTEFDAKYCILQKDTPHTDMIRRPFRL